MSGSGACATTMHLGLRVATGSIDAPVWSPLASAPVKVEGVWKNDGGVLVRDVVLTNPSAMESVTVVGIEWSTDAAGLGLPVDRMLHEGGIDPQSAPSPLFLGNHPTQVPHVWKKVSADGKHGAVAVFGWDDSYVTELDLPNDAYEVVPPTRRPAGGHSTPTVARHGARLFAW